MYNKVESNFFLTIREPYIHNVKTHPMKIEVLTLFLCAYCVISDRTNNGDYVVNIPLENFKNDFSTVNY